MKLSKKNWIVLSIGLIFIISGALEGTGILKLNEQTKSDFNMVLLVVACGLLFSGWKKKPDNKDDIKSELKEDNKEDNTNQDNKEEIKEDNTNQDKKDDNKEDNK